jgi:D-serine deaminase-like pyridoxal phosphate-dependent protein
MSTTAAEVDARMAVITRATEQREPPLAVLDRLALQANAEDLVRRANGLPIRVASKSIRCREVLRWVLRQPGYAGVLAFTLAEAIWLAGGAGGRHEPVSEDVLVAYPTADRQALRTLAADPVLAARVSIMVDSIEGLRLVSAAVGPGAASAVRVCLDLDASWRLARGRIHLGVRRSPVHSAQQIQHLARLVQDDPACTLVGVMSYEAQIAGLGDVGTGVWGRARAVAIRGVQSGSAREIRARRGEAVAAVREEADLEIVNGGGTGSLETSSRDSSLTEVAAGSGLFGPTLFDSYRAFQPRPAVMFALPVVRRPSAEIVTVLGGGWVASGPPGHDRLPSPFWPPGLRLLAAEGAGEVQTPLTGTPATRLRIGDRVWFRHAKAGEVCEHVKSLTVVDADAATTDWPTYRGDGRAFG